MAEPGQPNSRESLARQIGSWLPRPDVHDFALRPDPGLRLAETLAVEYLDPSFAGADSSAGVVFPSDVDLHLIRDRSGAAVSYARSRRGGDMPLLSLSTSSPLPSLIDQGLALLETEVSADGHISIILHGPLSLAALCVEKDGQGLFCLLRIEGSDFSAALRVMRLAEFVAIVRTAGVERSHRSGRRPNPPIE
ncbi:hypothetical protein [Polymorphobacter megasporae]|uniref:hypothetical protein n=1 Tax=Glacieibacterium megasporae TaxID=2835787 RepID=UPI001C1E5DB5|nr:hypothetical protein [Polymorphobacter megasporae]UAJ10993.1 hypothetical protein KTC28_04560 [Polymorphobacter megasporae]